MVTSIHATPGPGRYVKVATAGDMLAGQVLAAKLQAADIDVRVHSQALGPYPMTVGEFAATELWVIDSRLAEATEILLEAEVASCLANADPDHESVDTRPDSSVRIIASILGATMICLFILAILRVY